MRARLSVFTLCWIVREGFICGSPSIAGLDRDLRPSFSCQAPRRTARRTANVHAGHKSRVPINAILALHFRTVVAPLGTARNPQHFDLHRRDTGAYEV